MPEAKSLLESKTFCILPWIHVRLNQDGNLFPCCRASEFYHYGSLKEQTFAEIWNGAPVRAMRLALKNGEAPPQCSDCHKIESLGGVSARQEMNRHFAHAISRVEQTQADGTLAIQSLLYLDVRFSNLCNFRCRSCGPQNSSAWNDDAVQLGGVEATRVIRPKDDPDDLKKLLAEILPDLEWIYFAGGEPLLEDAHYELLESLIASGRTDVRLSYNTNFSTLERKAWRATDLWSRFKNVTVSASLDGAGEQGELLRKGMSWPRTEQNFRRLREKAPHVEFKIYSVITAMNAFHITDAIKTFLDNGMLQNPSQLQLNVALEPAYLAIHVLNEPERMQLRERYRSFVKSLEVLGSAGLKEHIANELERVLGYLASEVDHAARERFRLFTIRLDKLRGERFALLFPELFDAVYGDAGTSPGGGLLASSTSSK
jgi:radical SAM protein with 4Fe4S-binding SPASM domain